MDKKRKEKKKKKAQLQRSEASKVKADSFLNPIQIILNYLFNFSFAVGSNFYT